MRKIDNWIASLSYHYVTCIIIFLPIVTGIIVIVLFSLILK